MNYPEAKKLLDKYPYFAYAALKALRDAPDKESRDQLRRIVAVNIGDPADVAEILGLNTESLADFYPDTLPPQLDTYDTIDTFLSNFVSGDNLPSAPNPEIYIPEGAEQIPDKDRHHEDATTSAIDAFLRAVPPPQPVRQRHQPTPPPEESPALTESFAKILIKNHNYEKALEIIQDLNLKNPEKSIYFADQIRFLKKLILIKNKKH